MIVRVFDDKQALGKAAAEHAAAAIRAAISKTGSARVVAATGASQFEFLETLVKQPAITWGEVELFHLDEYIGLPRTHPASFCRYLQERLVSKTGITRFHFLDGIEDEKEIIRHTSEAIRKATMDIAFVGVGENGHLAFNDPPADFETNDPYIVVELDAACRRQQVGEGWFTNLEEVPTKAISMSIREILRAQEIVAVVPDARKANAVKECFEGPIGPMAPASILRKHSKATVYLDQQSASWLSPATLANYAARAEQQSAESRAPAT